MNDEQQTLRQREAIERTMAREAREEAAAGGFVGEEMEEEAARLLSERLRGVERSGGPSE